MTATGGIGTVAAAVLCLASATCAQGRVIVIGVDGFDYALCGDYIQGGQLPELAALSEAGSFVPLLPTNPAQSPVSWATLTTGRNPGSTGVFDFLRSGTDPASGGITAELALVRHEPNRGDDATRVPVAAGIAIAVLTLGAFLWSRRRRALAVALLVVAASAGILAWKVGRVRDEVLDRLPKNARRGPSVFERLDDAGVPAVSLLAPMSFPAPKLDHGHLLCGLGVPDVMGTPGTHVVFREEPVPAGRGVTPTGCRVRSIRDRGEGRLGDVAVAGPRPDPSGPRLEAPVDVRIDRNARTMSIDLGPGAARVAEGEWSPFLETTFDLPWFQTLRALTRYRVLEAGPRAVLYQKPACFDPRHQNTFVPITSPASFGAELCGQGMFDTLGWACGTNPLQDEVVGEDTFLSDIREIEAQRERLLWPQIQKPGWKFFFCLLSTPDRVQHLFWRDRDPSHPRHDPAAIARRGDPILESYRRIDALVGRIRKEVVRPGDLLLVVSDHGFAPFRWSVNLNRFLAEEGYLVGTGDPSERTLETSIGGPVLSSGIDLERTRAYSLGLGKIYAHGAGASPSARLDLLNGIRAKLLALRHDGNPVVRSAKLREEIYQGPHTGESADLIIGFERGFRVSWQCTLLGLDEPVIAPNRNLWSGDHCSVDPELVAGVLFSSRKLDQASADVADICPTIETALGVTPAADEDGKALRFVEPR
jgi:predicted AlkP superfamily phosphohydrolase/phosphomutase